MAPVGIKERARSAVGHAVSRGRIARISGVRCSCGRRAEDYHHPAGYEGLMALAVTPLCRRCHRRAHLGEFHPRRVRPYLPQLDHRRLDAWTVEVLARAGL